jgi:hypothetical protein
MSWPVFASSACVVFCLAAFFYFRLYIKRRTGAEATLAEIRDEVNRLLLRIDEITDKDVSLLEDREKSLKALIDEADKRLKVYARELERREKSGRALAVLSPGVVKETYTDIGSPRFREPPPETAAPGETRTEPVETTPGQEPQAAAPRFVRAEQQIAPEPKPINEHIRELARAGFSASVIASKLGISISEAELAVALLERKPL